MNKNNRIVTICVIVVFVMIGVYVFISSNITKEHTPNYNLDDFYVLPKRKLGVNEYKPVQVSDEDMVKTYFNNYVICFLEDPDRAYSYLSANAKKIYPTISAFKAHLSAITQNFTTLPEIDRYEYVSSKEAKVVKISDKSGYRYTFTIEAVMKYTVDFE